MSSGLNKRHKDKKCITLGNDLLNGGALQRNTNVLQILHTEMKSILAVSENLTALFLYRNFSVSKQKKNFQKYYWKSSGKEGIAR